MSLIAQYLQIKERYDGSLILFRCGDFYECYDVDAKEAAKILSITLIQCRLDANIKIYMAGFPVHALDAYLPKLIRAGKKVAIMDSLNSPTPIEYTYST